MLSQYKNFNLNNLDIDSLVELAAFGRSLREEYESHQLDEPEWVGIQLKSLRREIASRNADKLEASLREKKARIETLKSPTEKRKELQSEIDELEEKLTKV